MNYELWADWVVDADLEQRLRDLWRRSGEEAQEPTTHQVEAHGVTLGDEVLVAASPLGADAVGMPWGRPRALLEDALRLPTTPGEAELRSLRRWRRRAGVDRPGPVDLVTLTWDTPDQWQPATVQDGRAPVLDPASGLFIGLGGPEELLPDLQGGAALLESEGWSPGGRSRLAIARQMRERDGEYPLPSWDIPEEVTRFCLGGLLERAAVATAENVHIGPLQPGARTAVFVEDDREQFGQVRTVWEALTTEGEICGVAVALSHRVDLLDHAPDPWSLGGELAPPSGSHRTLSGEPVDRLGSRPSRPEIWTGGPFVTMEFEDTGETYTDQVTMRLLGRVTFPSRQLVLADSDTLTTGGRTVDLELADPGPYPVLDLAIDEDRGLLVLLGAGEPTRWAATPSVGGGDAPIVDRGDVVILDRDAAARLAPLTERYDLFTWRRSSGGTLLRSEPSGVPDGTSLAQHGPVAAVVGLDRDDQPVALLLDTYPLVPIDSTTDE